MQPFQLRGRIVEVVRTADIPPLYLPNGKLHWVVRAALKEVEPWLQGELPIETVELPGAMIKEVVVPTNGHRVMWGTHALHSARNPQPSPFVRVVAPLTNIFTLELGGTPRNPKLFRGYPGEYFPPLPWQNSARNADGGLEFCREYWQTHAYVLYRGLMRAPRAPVPPPWFHHTKPRHRR